MNLLTKFQTAALVLSATLATNAAAQIVRDGSIGPDASVQPMPDANGRFVIDQSMGALFGDSADVLLHSFGEFSVLTGQEALFSGDPTVSVIINRVTGTTPTTIDGTLSSSISGADFYLLNPRGVMFGANATVNLGGDLNVSTADTLMFADGESLQVYSQNVPPIIRSSLPAAFGFLPDTAGDITLDGTKLLYAGAMSLNARNIALQNEAVLESSSEVNLLGTALSVDSTSSVRVFSGIGQDVSGDISLTAQETITLDGAGGSASLFTIAQQGSQGSQISLVANEIHLQNGTQILSRNNDGAAADISLEATSGIYMSGVNDTGKGVTLFSNTINTQQAGSITLTAPVVDMGDGADLLSSNPGGGDTGAITITASERLRLAGNDQLGDSTDQANIQNVTSSAGNAGDITISTGTLEMLDAARIQNGSQNSGNGGNISISATQQIVMSGNHPVSRFGSSISSTAIGFGLAGTAGDIVIDAPRVALQDGARISSGSVGGGDGGNISITAAQSLDLGGRHGNDTPEDAIEGANNGSRIEVQAFDGSTGDAGDITINAGAINLRDGAIILSNAYQGDGGNIGINADQIINIDSDIVSSVRESQGNGGDVIIGADLLVLGNSDILARAAAGNGGTINIEAVDQYVALAGSVLDASSDSGIDGDVITPPEVRGELDKKPLRTEYLDVAAIAKSSCTDLGQPSGTTLLTAPIVQPSPEGLLPAYVPAKRPDTDNDRLVLTRGGERKPLTQVTTDIARSADTALKARRNIELGDFHLVDGNFDQARKAYQASLNQLPTRGTSAAQTAMDKIRAHANLARLAMQQGAITDAQQSLWQADTLLGQIASDAVDADLLIHLAKSYSLMAERRSSQFASYLLRAHALFRQAESTSHNRNDLRAKSYATGNIGELYRLEQRHDEALILARQALSTAEQAQAPESEYRWHWLEGQSLHSLGDRTAAMQAYRRALAVIDESRQATLNRYDSSQTYFEQLVAPVYLELIELIFESELADQSQSQQFLFAARETLERYKTAELKNYFQDDCVARYVADQTPLDAVSPTTAVVYPIELADRLELLISLPGAAARSIQRFSVPVSQDELHTRVRSFRNLLDQFSQDPALMTHSRWLYDHLVRPYGDRLKDANVDTLVYVPTGVLSQIPMAALHDGDHYLIRDYALASTVGLSLTDPKPLHHSNRKVLLGGVSTPVGDFPALDSVPGELNAVRNLFGGDVLLNQDFTFDNFKQQISQYEYSIVHIASHAQFTGDTAGNFLQAYDRPIYFDDLARTLGVAKFRENSLELLVLSACQTAIGDDRAALGLAGVGIKAGARSALATLWSISDESAAELIELFYANLKTSQYTKAESLRMAQLTMLDQPRYSHPYHWSAFTLLNNWL